MLAETFITVTVGPLATPSPTLIYLYNLAVYLLVQPICQWLCLIIVDLLPRCEICK